MTSQYIRFRPCTCSYNHLGSNIHDYFTLYLLVRIGSNPCIQNKPFTSRLWVHEMLRIFYDRLIDLNDKEWLFLEMRKTVEECFNEEFDIMFDGLDGNDTDVVCTNKSMYST